MTFDPLDKAPSCKMVKTLEDYCLACIARHVATYSRLGNVLSLRHKEVLLERMCWHQQLTPVDTPTIFYNLFSHTLLRINLSYSPQVSDKTLELLGNSGCLPTSIVLHDCPNVTDKGIASLNRILRKTEVLKLKKLKQITGEGLKSVVTRSLKYVNLQYSTGISDEGIIKLVKNCPNIERLNVCDLHKLSDASFTQVAASLAEKLTEIIACEMNLVTSLSTLAMAEHCRNLSVAKFESCVRLDGSGLVQMAERCNLSTLCISFCYKVSPQNIDIIISLLRAKGTLTTFEGMGIGMSPLAMEMVASTSCLSSVALCGVTALNDEAIELVTKVAGSTLLEFDVSNCLWLTNRSCASIARHCKVLESLGMRNLREVNGTELSLLFLDKRAKNFKSVTLSGAKNMPSSVVHDIATHCTNLETLTVAGLKDIDDHIATAISLNCPNMKYISFRNCQLTDDSICEIAVSCSKLRMIALAGIHNLTDKCIIALAENCPNMRELYVSGCAKITRQAITYLKDCAVGRVFVNHSTPNAPIGLLMGKDLDTGHYTRVDDVEFDSLTLKRELRAL